MRRAQKFIALMQDTDSREYFIQYFKSFSKRDICKKKRKPAHKVEAVLNFNEPNIQKMKYHVETLNRLTNINTRKQMRMWNVNPEKMCRKHLLGEHVEMHMFIGALEKRISIEGYIKKGLVNPNAIKTRHDELAKEMIRRKYCHLSPIKFDCSDLPVHPIPIKRNERELRNRCKECQF